MILALFAASASSNDNGLLPKITAKAYYTEVERPSDVPTDAELESKGSRVGNVTIHVKDIFDTSNTEENTQLFRLGNKLHINTRESTVKQQLLFQSGDVYSGIALAESERLLRSREYLFDARIRPIQVENGRVDIEVITRDVWTLKPGISFSRSGGKNTSALEFEEVNLFGTGARIVISNKSDVDRDSLIFFFRDNNLGKSWWDLTLSYADSSDGDSNSIRLDHPFYSLTTRKAGGISGDSFDRISSKYDLGKVVDQFAVEEEKATVYYGWSSGFKQGWTTRFKTGVTLNNRQFGATTGQNLTINLPENIKLVYPWISVERLEDDYRKQHNRNQINRTEDIELGWRMKAALGYASSDFGADRHSWIFSASLRNGLSIRDTQTLLWSTSLSGRRERQEWTNILLGGQFQYHYRQSSRRTFYLAFGADGSDNLDLDSQILLGGDNGLRGYPLRYQAGEGRWLITAEQRYFSSWYPFRLFNVGAAIFADAGRTFGDNLNGSASKGILRDIGFGFRLGNSRSGLGNVIHFDFAFPLDGNGDVDDFQFLIQTKRSF